MISHRSRCQSSLPQLSAKACCSFLLLPLLLLLLLSTTPTASAQKKTGLTVSGILDIDSECYEPLNNADTNGDGRVDRDEYVIFLNSISDDYFSAACRSNNPNNCRFERLPLAMQSNFINLACLCERFEFGVTSLNSNIISSNTNSFRINRQDETNQCCTGDNAHISTRGTETDNPTTSQALYLFTVCRDTYNTLEEVVTEAPTPNPTTLAPTALPTPVITLPPTVTPTAPPITITAAPTGLPTAQPTQAPVVVIVPTSTPTATPTTSPTAQPTLATETPTASPTTKQPSPIPTAAPITSRPTRMPVPFPTTQDPTSTPTRLPTVSPTSAPTAATLAPTAAPSRMPVLTGDLPISFQYTLENSQGLTAEQIKSGANGNTVTSDLTQALDLLIPEIIAEEFGAAGRNRSRRSLRVIAADEDNRKTNGRRERRLAVEFTGDTPTTVDSVEDIACPADAAPSSTCQSVTSTATISITDENPADIEARFQRALAAAIASGRLDEKLAIVNPDSSVSNTGPAVAGPPPQDPKAISSGGIAGVAIGGALLAGAIAAFLLVKRKRSADRKDLNQLEDVDVVGDDMYSEESPYYPPSGPPGQAETPVQSNLGAKKPMYGRTSKKSKQYEQPIASSSLGGGGFDDLSVDPSQPSLPGSYGGGAPAASPAMETGAGGMGAGAAAGIAAGAAVGAAAIGAAAYAGSPKTEDDDSSAGSSGWSSASGRSSLDQEEGDLLGKAVVAGAVAGAAGSASGSASASASRGSGSASASVSRGVDAVPSTGSVTRDDLDTAIEAGDWAAVGATAALLASASDSASNFSGASSHRSASTKSSVSTLDAARAAELDKLVDQGDWEGVVMAASKYEAESSKSGSGSIGRGGSVQDGRSIGTGGSGSASASAYTQSTAGGSDKPSDIARRAEIRTEVEALVRRVVPDEIDNVDEMMLQFRGREEELVETLRTMQERSVAQKARAAVHRSAKISARRSVEQQRALAAAAMVSGGSTSAGQHSSGPSVEDSATTATSASEELLYPQGKPRSRSASRTKSRSPSTSQSALEKAIEAGDWSAVGEAAALMSEAESDTFETASQGRSITSSIADQHRAMELDTLIDQGDWKGVVAAASRYSAITKSTSSDQPSIESLQKNKSSSSESSSWRRRMFGGKSKGAKDALVTEEEEAKAQAALWQEIANQSKTTSSSGAGDAADWAIQRELTKMTEKKTAGTGSGEV